MIVWDEGTYEPIEEISGKKEQEKALLKELKSGSIKIKLHGKKLEGEFALVKTNGMGENAWLLIKHNDAYASTKEITKKDESVLSGKTIETMTKTGEKVWKSGHEETIKKPNQTDKKKAVEPIGDKTKKDESSVADDISVESLLKGAPKANFPLGITPMLATLVDEPFDDRQ